MVSKSELQYYLETAHKNIEADKHVTTGQRLGVCLHEKPQLCTRNVICKWDLLQAKYVMLYVRPE